MRIAAAVPLVAMATLATVARADHGPSLRERIEAARAEARARAEAEAQAAAKQALDPESDPRFWRIDKFHIPVVKVLGFDFGGAGAGPEGGPEARFYAELDEDALEAGTAVGTVVYFYELSGDGLHLAGRGQIRKIRPRRGRRVVEAALRSFRHAKRAPFSRRTIPFLGGGKQQEALQLTAGRSPESESWYMSTKLEGPDVEGWTIRDFEEFALGNPWVGMTEHALLALLGPPTQRLEVPAEAVLIWGVGDDAQRFTVRDGRVADIAAGRY